jgi:hypothetical protein
MQDEIDGTNLINNSGNQINNNSNTSSSVNSNANLNGGGMNAGGLSGSNLINNPVTLMNTLINNPQQCEGKKLI